MRRRSARITTARVRDLTPLQARNRAADAPLGAEVVWRVVRAEDNTCSLRRVALLASGRAALLGSEPLLEVDDLEEMRAMLDAIDEGVAAGPISTGDLVPLEFIEQARFVIQQRHYYRDYPEWSDLNDENERPLGFASEAEAQAHIDDMLDRAYESNLRRWQREQDELREARDLYARRCAVLEANGLWDEHALEGPLGFDRAAPVRASGEDYRVVAIEDSEWFYS